VEKRLRAEDHPTTQG